MHSIGYNFHSTFLLAISFRNQQFFPKLIFFLLEVNRELPQRLTLKTSLVVHSFSIVLLHSFNPVCSYIFVCVAFQPIDFVLFQTCHIFVNSSILKVASNFYSSWEECPTNLWTLPTFSDLANMTREDLTSPCRCSSNCSG